MQDSSKNKQPCVSWKVSPLKAKAMSPDDVSRLFCKSSTSSATRKHDPFHKLWDRLQPKAQSTIQRTSSLPVPSSSNFKERLNNIGGLKRSRTLESSYEDETETANKLSRVSSLVSVIRQTIDRKKSLERRVREEQEEKTDNEDDNDVEISTQESLENNGLAEKKDDTSSLATLEDDIEGQEFSFDDQDLQMLQDIEDQWLSSQKQQGSPLTSDHISK
ncbi:double strand break localizing Dbl1, implicated in DNA repair [Schizosaccharomyces pombe]|uniref:Uncharacterized protein C2H8.05c n=1 Tax=Schizosaccharomyces pombe (strain 972 / ATCC 24843) TaxID=284812 RepID=YCX5_SCHPO|nr:uncharacterized protein SPCC2H8.05c [Schizosaccharomyces pombe]Q9Y7S8.2 RecName: Full=Uncharacterized protein C2H8.05c [Schizosaccharomyces pombe 972h-]CAB40209.3 sequence orphan [Schizosaccharomyces pombe]|eukprot:NP_587975.2 uncharacterized protein SPCC2H8.05c [Schizosaccharomyces pombe]